MQLRRRCCVNTECDEFRSCFPNRWICCHDTHLVAASVVIAASVHTGTPSFFCGQPARKDVSQRWEERLNTGALRGGHHWARRQYSENFCCIKQTHHSRPCVFSGSRRWPCYHQAVFIQFLSATTNLCCTKFIRLDIIKLDRPMQALPVDRPHASVCMSTAETSFVSIHFHKAPIVGAEQCIVLHQHREQRQYAFLQIGETVVVESSATAKVINHAPVS